LGEKKYKVFMRNKDFKGRRFGVPFENGEGNATKKEAIVLVKNWKYRCPELYPEKEKAETGDGKKKNTKPGSNADKSKVSRIVQVATTPKK
jgi:hypothetical protein